MPAQLFEGQKQEKEDQETLQFAGQYLSLHCSQGLSVGEEIV